MSDATSSFPAPAPAHRDTSSCQHFRPALSECGRSPPPFNEPILQTTPSTLNQQHGAATLLSPQNSRRTAPSNLPRASPQKNSSANRITSTPRDRHPSFAETVPPRTLQTRQRPRLDYLNHEQPRRAHNRTGQTARRIDHAPNHFRPPPVPPPFSATGVVTYAPSVSELRSRRYAGCRSACRIDWRSHREAAARVVRQSPRRRRYGREIPASKNTHLCSSYF